MLIVQIALGIVLAFFIIGILLHPLTEIISLTLIIGVIIVLILYFIIDKLTEPMRKRHYKESWKRFNEQNKNE